MATFGKFGVKKAAAVPVASKKTPVPAAAVEDETVDSEETEAEEAAPVVKKPAAKVALAKKPAPKAAEPEEDDEEEAAEEAEEAEEEEAAESEEAAEEAEEAPAAKKPLGKKPVAAPAPSKKAVQKTAPVAAPAAGKKASAWGKKDEKPAREYPEGSWLPQDEFLRRFHARLQEKGLAPPTLSTTTQIFKELESLLRETLETHDVTFMEKSKATEMAARVYAPNTALEVVNTPYHTMMLPYRRVTLTLPYGKKVIRGTVDDSGEFYEAQYNEKKGTFTAGTWGVDEAGEETFTPAASAKAAPKGKK